MNLRNQILIEGTLITNSALRTTPSGIAVIDGTIAHLSSQLELGKARKVEFEISFLAMGNVAQAIAQLPSNPLIKCKGFLAAKNQRTRHILVLHIDAFELLN
ncbi:MULTISPECIES: primosomal replication protein N [Deefgea]|uniref:primosomal replication protein N n=1 Tax=Deefgea TaxID=400947 RepID=UPI0023B2415B|nr:MULTISPECIES: primosomal replication protein N [Deefgea]